MILRPILAIFFASLVGIVVGALWRGEVSISAATAEQAADSVFVDKSERRLDLHRDGRVIRSYRVALGGNPAGPKRREGDERTPEGHYVIDWRNPKSAYHLSLHIDYPRPADRAASAGLGVPPGGDIFIHGLPNFWPGATAPKIDWTEGCIALDNAEIEEIWHLVPDGTPILIVP
ncbi:MAG: L,D-transpeptidase family protein [Rhodospirillaceae bacterium]|nr:L,D-transpeptidase family protein [Rhodospirillaceae bacterium]